MSYRCRFVIAYVLFVILIYNINSGSGKRRLYYFSVERPRVSFSHPDYLANIRFKAERTSRTDPVHYANLSFMLTKTANNEMTHSFYLYQLLTNVYKRSFVEFHYNTCDLMLTQNMFGTSALTGYYQVPAAERNSPLFQCPLPPGFYRFEKVKLLTSYIPLNFPFDEGRIYYNVTIGQTRICNGHIDFQLLTEQ